MNAFSKFISQHGIHHPVLLDPRLGPERFSHDLDPEMALAIGPGAGMAGMLMRFIDHVEMNGLESIP